MIAIDSNKQQALDADPNTIQQINFTGNLARQVNADTTTFFIIKESKETILNFSHGTVRLFLIYFALMYKMPQYNTLKVILSNSQLNKLKPSNFSTEVTLNLSLNVIGNSNDETNFPHELLLTNTQVSRIHKAFANNSSGNINLTKTQLAKIVQPGGFLGRLL